MFNTGKVRQVLCLSCRIGGQKHFFLFATAKRASIDVHVTKYSTLNFFKNRHFRTDTSYQKIFAFFAHISLVRD
jgi:hypothetical protein